MQQVRGLAVALFIITFFGALWGMVGAFALPGALSLLAGVLVGAATVVHLLSSARLLRLSQRLPVAAGDVGTNPFGTRSYRLAVLFEVTAIPISAAVLNNAGYPRAVISAVAVIVGLQLLRTHPRVQVTVVRGSRRSHGGGRATLAGATDRDRGVTARRVGRTGMRARAVGKRLPAAGIYSAQSRSMTLLTTLCPCQADQRCPSTWHPVATSPPRAPTAALDQVFAPTL